MGVLCSHWVIQYSLGFLSDCGGVSSPGDSGSRSTSGDTGEVELISTSIHLSKVCHDVSYSKIAYYKSLKWVGAGVASTAHLLHQDRVQHTLCLGH